MSLKLLLTLIAIPLTLSSLYAMELSGPTSLQRKVGDGDANAVDTLRDLGKVNEPDAPGGRTALYYAASSGQIPNIDKLLKAKANPNVKYGKNGFTALLIAVQREQLEALKRLLAYNETDVGATSNEGENIFHIAVDREPSAGPDIIAVLQNYKGNKAKQLTELINKTDKTGITPLRKAINKSSPRTALALSKFPGIQISDADRIALETLLHKFPTAQQSVEPEL